jgi:hypothetical protein
LFRAAGRVEANGFHALLFLCSAKLAPPGEWANVGVMEVFARITDGG